MAETLPQASMLSVAEHFVSACRQLLPVADCVGLELDDILGVASASPLRISLN